MERCAPVRLYFSVFLTVSLVITVFCEVVVAILNQFLFYFIPLVPIIIV